MLPSVCSAYPRTLDQVRGLHELARRLRQLVLEHRPLLGGRRYRLPEALVDRRGRVPEAAHDDVRGDLPLRAHLAQLPALTPAPREHVHQARQVLRHRPELVALEPAGRQRLHQLQRARCGLGRRRAGRPQRHAQRLGDREPALLRQAHVLRRVREPHVGLGGGRPVAARSVGDLARAVHQDVEVLLAAGDLA